MLKDTTLTCQEVPDQPTSSTGNSEESFNQETSGLYQQAKRELRAMGMLDGDVMNAMMSENVLQLLATFAAQGHSGFSAGYCINLSFPNVKPCPLGHGYKFAKPTA